MINRLLLEHIVLMSNGGGRSPLNGKPIRSARMLLHRPTGLLQPIAMKSPSHIAAWAEYMIRENFGDIPPPTSFIETRLLQCVMLSRLGEQMALQEDRPRYGVSTIGSMLQRDLMILLLEIDWEDWAKILSLTNDILSAEAASRWRIMVIGAAAGATVAHTLMERQGALVLLPTPFEDVKLGIDLFWLEDGQTFCISVKSRCSVLGVQAELVMDGDGLDLNRRKILGGTRDVNRRLGESFSGVFVEVGRQKVGDFLPILPEANHWPRGILHDSRTQT